MINSVQGVSSTFAAQAAQSAQPLTADQKSQVQSILSQYDPTKMTADSAKSLFSALRDAGIRPNSEVRSMMSTAGFDPTQMRSLAGVQGHHHGHHHGGGQAGAADSAASADSTSGVDASKLQSLQSILNQYDLTNITSDQQSDLFTKLGAAGLMQTGNTINLSA